MKLSDEGWKEVTGKRSAWRNLQLDEKEKESIEDIDYAELGIQEINELFKIEEVIERFYVYSTTTLASDSVTRRL